MPTDRPNDLKGSATGFSRRRLQAGFFCRLLIGIMVTLMGSAQEKKELSAPRTDSALRLSPKANELGRILILEYHRFQEQEGAWTRSLSNFRQDLRRLYEEGFRPISMAEFLDGSIAIPAGNKPVLFTFDDSSPGQLRWLEQSGKPRIDPECAVGILLDFRKSHADFDLKGIFFVLPEAKQPHKLFGQPRWEAEKLRQLTQLGFEIGNHTLWHADLKRYAGPTVQKQIALAMEYLQKILPGYPLRALALPMGNYPTDPAWAVEGSFGRLHYSHQAVFRAVGGPAYSPFHVLCDFTRLPRIPVSDKELSQRLVYFQNHPQEAYVSDGDAFTVTAPANLLPSFNTCRFPRHRAVIAP